MAYQRKWDLDVLTKKEFWRLIGAATETDNVGGLRLAAMMAVMGGAGLRLSELLALEVKDIDMKRSTLTVQRGKGGKFRRVDMAKSCMAVLAKWLDQRERQSPDAFTPAGAKKPVHLVFCSFGKRGSGKPVWQSRIARDLHELATSIGLEKRCNPHAFRHSHACWMAEDGVPIHSIRRQLGHGSLRTTDVYLTELVPTAFDDGRVKFDV